MMLTKQGIGALGLVATLALAGPSLGDVMVIPGLYNTGVDDSGATLDGGEVDTNYFILETESHPYVVSEPHQNWLANDNESKWIWEQPDGLPINVTRTFRLTFDLTGLDPSTASIEGLWSTDNHGLDILINDQSTGNTADDFTQAYSFSITDGFVEGINTLDFVVYDFGSIAGFRVLDITGSAMVIPAPGALFMLGLAAFAPRRRRS